MSRLYMVVTKDEYEEPLAVAESMAELGRIIGVDKASICRGIQRHKRGGKSKYRMIEVDDDD